jgi:GntR family negative regulator for fad regulon and positive regulator of fabA
MNWETRPKPADLAESRLIVAILDGHFPIGDTLPAERELATQLGVTRPTLREVLQRMARDGWIEIRHGRPTRVRNYWQEGKLGVLTAIAQYPEHAPTDFVRNLLVIRLLMAPEYTRQAVAQSPGKVVDILSDMTTLDENPTAFALADWNLQYQLTVLSGNPIVTLILNGFEELYQKMAIAYFGSKALRDHSRAFYGDLLEVTQNEDHGQAERLTRNTMAESMDLWRKATSD